MDERIKEYLPESCWLYYVDYNDSFDNNLDLLQQCLETNGLYPITETMDDWWEFPEQYELEEIKKKMVADGLEKEFDENYEEIREWLWDHDKSTPIQDLFSNTGDVTMFYECDLNLDHGWRSGFFCTPWRNESTAMAAYKIRRFLGIKKGTKEAAQIDQIVEESYSGGSLRLYFRGDIRDFLTNNDDDDFKTIHFEGEVAVAVYNATEGCGDYDLIKINRDLPFIRKNLRISECERYNIERCFGLYDDFCESRDQKIYVTKKQIKHVPKLKVSPKLLREQEYERVFKAGGCTHGDTNMGRHRDVKYINEIPCRWECPHCGQEWLD